MVAALLVGFPAVARADAAIPMLPVAYPAILWFLLPVVLIETMYLVTDLRTRWRRTIVAVTGINLVTMGLGYPLAWLLYDVLNRLLGFPPGRAESYINMAWVPVWVCEKLFPNWEGLRDEMLPVLAIFVVLLVPSYLLSRFMKSWLVDWYDLLHYKTSTKSAIMMANRLSYLFLVGVGCFLLYRLYTGL